MKKQIKDEYVDSSFTTLYLFFTILCSVAVSFAFQDATLPVFVAVLGYAVVSYFIWDLIRQLFYPGQALFLYVVTFFILPALMNYFLEKPVGSLAVYIYVAANVCALVFDLIYESLIKKRLPGKVLRRLLSADAKVDRSIAPLSVKHFQLTEFRGMIVALVLVIAYFLAILLLLHR